MSQPNWENRTLFHGDNLPFLRAMNSESVDLIATDPPFKRELSRWGCRGAMNTGQRIKI